MNYFANRLKEVTPTVTAKVLCCQWVEVKVHVEDDNRKILTLVCKLAEVLTIFLFSGIIWLRWPFLLGFTTNVKRIKRDFFS